MKDSCETLPAASEPAANETPTITAAERMELLTGRLHANPPWRTVTDPYAATCGHTLAHNNYWQYREATPETAPNWHREHPKSEKATPYYSPRVDRVAVFGSACLDTIIAGPFPASWGQAATADTIRDVPGAKAPA